MQRQSNVSYQRTAVENAPFDDLLYLSLDFLTEQLHCIEPKNGFQLGMHPSVVDGIDDDRRRMKFPPMNEIGEKASESGSRFNKLRPDFVDEMNLGKKIFVRFSATRSDP